MKLFKLRSCMCLPLGSGLLIIALLELIGYVYVGCSILHSYILDGMISTKEDEILKLNDETKREDQLMEELVAGHVVVIHEVVGFLSTVILLIGYAKKKYRCIDVWLVVHLITVPIMLAFHVRSVMEWVDASNYEIAVIASLLGAATIIVNVYFILVIFSYRNWLKEESERPIEVDIIDMTTANAIAQQVQQHLARE